MGETTVTQFTDLATKKYSVFEVPTEARYWSKPRLARLKEFLEDSFMDYKDWETRRGPDEYRAVTLTVVQYLKSFPEWKDLTDKEATRAIGLGLQKLGVDWFDFPINEVSQEDSQQEFAACWRTVKFSKEPDGRRQWPTIALERARQYPVELPKELEDLMRPCSQEFMERYSEFFGLCCHLQQMAPAGGYILLPQTKIAELMGVNQRLVSYWIRTLKDAGYLTLEQKHVPTKQAARYRCHHDIPAMATM